MKKLLSIIISSVVVAIIAISLIVITININNEKEYSVTVGSSLGGVVQLTVDETVHDIGSNREKTFEIKKKSKVTLKAIPELGYEFTNWEINAANKSSDVEIEINVSKQNDIYAVFSVKKVNLTVLDENKQETVLSYSPLTTLLSYLEEKFKADAGYKYIFKIGDQVITETTQISENAQITVTKVPIEYTVTYKNADGSNFKVYTFTVESDINGFETPEVPSIAHYTTAWEKEANYKLLENQVINLTKTPIEYSMKFVHKGNQIGEIVKYTIETDYSKIEKPVIEESTGEDYYTFAWPKTVEYTFSTDAQVVESIKTGIENTIVYKDSEGNVIATITFTKDDFVAKSETIFVAPNAPEKEFYTITWSKDLQTILAEDLNTYCGKDKSISTEITTKETATVYTVNFVASNGETLTSTDNAFSADDMTIKYPKAQQNGVFYLFEEKELVLGENITINATAYSRIKFNKILETGHEVVGSSSLPSVYVKLLEDGKFEMADGKVVLYNVSGVNQSATKVEYSTLVEALSTYGGRTANLIVFEDTTSTIIHSFVRNFENSLSKAIELHLAKADAIISISFDI